MNYYHVTTTDNANRIISTGAKGGLAVWDTLDYALEWRRLREDLEGKEGNLVICSVVAEEHHKGRDTWIWLPAGDIEKVEILKI